MGEGNLRSDFEDLNLYQQLSVNTEHHNTTAENAVFIGL